MTTSEGLGRPDAARGVDRVAGGSADNPPGLRRLYRLAMEGVNICGTCHSFRTGSGTFPRQVGERLHRLPWRGFHCIISI